MSKTYGKRLILHTEIVLFTVHQSIADFGAEENIVRKENEVLSWKTTREIK